MTIILIKVGSKGEEHNFNRDSISSKNYNRSGVGADTFHKLEWQKQKFLIVFSTNSQTFLTHFWIVIPCEEIIFLHTCIYLYEIQSNLNVCAILFDKF